MAYATTDVQVAPADGWKKVATAPAYVRIRPLSHAPWFVAAVPTGGAAPAASVVGLQYGWSDGFREEFLDTSLSGCDIYIRVSTPGASSVGDTQQFGVITG